MVRAIRVSRYKKEVNGAPVDINDSAANESNTQRAEVIMKIVVRLKLIRFLKYLL